MLYHIIIIGIVQPLVDTSKGSIVYLKIRAMQAGIQAAQGWPTSGGSICAYAEHRQSYAYVQSDTQLCPNNTDIISYISLYQTGCVLMALR